MAPKTDRIANFANGTSVTVAKTKTDIERLITRFGATSFVIGHDGPKAFLAFRYKERNIKFSLTLPQAGNYDFPSQPKREAEERRLWRCLHLLVKAKLAAVSDGVAVFDEEFYAHVMTATGETMYERTKDALALEYKEKKVQPLMIGGPR